MRQPLENREEAEDSGFGLLWHAGAVLPEPLRQNRSPGSSRFLLNSFQDKRPVLVLLTTIFYCHTAVLPVKHG